jgi:phage terminase large subunit-like protein
MDAQTRLLELLQAEHTYNAMAYMFPDTGPFRRELYVKHMAFITAGATHRERCLMGGNGTGKSVLGAYETACHVTGRYPDWWTGWRVKNAIQSWVAGDTSETVRDITQVKLFGNVSKDPELLGTGLIPLDAIDAESIRYRPNTNRAIDFARVKSADGSWSVVSLKSYEQGRKAFQGTEIPWIWLDEEPKKDSDIYGECLMRGRTVDGHIALTFTPLSGWTEIVQGFMEWEKAKEAGASRIMVTCGWDDVPHLTEKEKTEQLASTKPFLRDARKYGVPVSGAGKIYPIPEDDFVIPPIQLPNHYRRCFGFDGGWLNTAAVWVAWDKDHDVAYLYSEYKRGEVEIPMHAAAIKARGVWIPGVGDAAATSQTDGQKLLDLYRTQGVRMKLPDKSVDAGIQDILTRLAEGRLKVFSTCAKWIQEFRQYSYGKDGHPHKTNDHLMDATRYAIYGGGLRASTVQKIAPTQQHEEFTFGLYR